MAHAARPTLRRRLLAALARLAPLPLRPLLRLLHASMRVEILGAEELRAHWTRGQRAILCFWHNRLLMLPIIAGGAPMCIMVSQHRDGELAAGLLGAWGIATVRGSTTRGGVGGFLRMVDAYRRGHNLVVLPDGPRGPRYVAKPGVVHLARATGAPVYPMAYAATRVRQLRSWDRLLVPSPFARAVVVVGAPLAVPANASAEDLAALRGEIEQRLVAVTTAAEARAGMTSLTPDPAPPGRRAARPESLPPP